MSQRVRCPAVGTIAGTPIVGLGCWNATPTSFHSLDSGVTCRASAQDAEQLLAESNPAIQKQLQAIDRVIRPVDGLANNVEALREVQKLKELTDDEAELVKQVAIFAMAPGEEMQPMTAGVILQYMRLPSRVTIRTLAPYLDTKNPQLRSFVRDWFKGHDNAGPGQWTAPDYKEYLDFVRWKTNRKEDVPGGFTKYIFERSPGHALLVFASANSHGDVAARMQALREAVGKSIDDVPQPNPKPDAQEAERGRQLSTKESREARLKARRQIELAEHIVSNAIWLDKHDFIVRFQSALPEVKEAFATLMQGEWWARLYVAYIMRQHPKLRQDELLQQLTKDENELVKEIAQIKTPGVEAGRLQQ